MMDNDMVEESIDRLLAALESYHRIMGTVPVEPILLRTMSMLRIALNTGYMGQELPDSDRIFEAII